MAEQTFKPMREGELSLPQVVLSHGGIQYSYPLAHALQEARFLKSFFTTFYLSKKWEHSWLQKYFSRRHDASLKQELINSDPWPEALQRMLACFTFGNGKLNNHLVHARNRLFDERVSKELKNIPFDILIGLSGGALRSIQTAKALGKKTIVDQHDIHYSLAARLLNEERELHPEFASSIPYFPPLKSYLDCVEEEFQTANYIMVPSTFSFKSHVQAGIPEEKLILMLHGSHAPEEEVKPVKREGKIFRILFVGTITQRKGIKYLLEAVKHLNCREIELILIGDQMSNEKALAPYRDFFKYVGYQPSFQLKEYLKDAHLLVLPSIFDAFGLVALDAMAAGLPVIVSEHTAAGSDVVRDGVDGFVVPIRDVQALEDRIFTLFHNESLRIEMAQNAHARVREFSWTAYAHRLEHVLKQIFSSSFIHSS